MVIEVVIAVLMIVIFTRLAPRSLPASRPEGLLLEPVRSGAAVHSRRHCPAGDRQPRRHDHDDHAPHDQGQAEPRPRSWPRQSPQSTTPTSSAVPLDDLLLRAVCNLFGLVPWAGLGHGRLGDHLALACMTFATVIFSGMAKLGPVGFWVESGAAHGPAAGAGDPAQADDLRRSKCWACASSTSSLAMRLLANMMAGHLVLAVILAFIAAERVEHRLVSRVMPASVLGAVRSACSSCSWRFCRLIFSRFCPRCSSAWPCIRTKPWRRR